MAVTASTLQPLRGDKRWAYLSRARTIRIATLNEDGTIYLSPLWLVVHDKKIYIPIDAASKHGANFRAGRALSALVDGGDEYATVSGVRISGTMSEVTDTALADTLAQVVFDKYFHVGHPYADNYLEFGEVAGRTYFELVPDKMIGWDMREITTLAVPEIRTLPAHVGDRLL
ncbi:pyridoxamine 5'-phosphate oxidase family protein [Pseudonocardia endophytica]|uniref:Pyridoxamine 5'-phosphate oxidase n=1 Tax=Pseudonocardia endophytica TaxID=401976 RepID=A0A4R1I1Z2_PSEEN|nr:pyridoxamine 5'-phosphate oxidase family protein [Pseudonocardia endophytica]TCK27605.1 pyridoxamine 5'-phosphate oxidase [Pseudonocardia endophytica]